MLISCPSLKRAALAGRFFEASLSDKRRCVSPDGVWTCARRTETPDSRAAITRGSRRLNHDVNYTTVLLTKQRAKDQVFSLALFFPVSWIGKPREAQGRIGAD